MLRDSTRGRPCRPTLCRHVEAKEQCTMSARSARPCRLGATCTLLDNCSACGVEPEPFHIGAGARPQFPPRSQHVWCTSEATQRVTHEHLHALRPPPTQHQLHTRYRESLDALEHAALHECLCELDGALRATA